MSTVHKSGANVGTFQTVSDPYRVEGSASSGTVGNASKWIETFFEKDPITGRNLSQKCWNGFHEDWDGEEWNGICHDQCECMCHDERRGVEASGPASDDHVPGV